MYVYYVTYHHRMGYGCIEITMDYKVKDYDDVMSMAQTIEDLGKAKGVVITHYILLKRASKEMKEKLKREKNWFQRLCISLFF
jgi:hypothetical protein